MSSYSDNINNFRTRYTLETRQNESSSIIKNYPDRAPVILQSKCVNLEKHKYLV